MKALATFLVVVTASLSPTFYLAKNVSRDEYLKSGIAAVQIGAVVTIYRLYLRSQNKEQ